MFLSVNGVGTLTADPEIKYLPSGTCIATFSIANNETYKGEQKVCFTECSVFGGLAEKVVGRYLKKGSKVYVCGKLKLDQWTDQNGGKRSKHSITVDNLQMLDSKPSNGETNQASQQGYQQQNNGQSNQQAPRHINIDDSEIPF